MFFIPSLAKDYIPCGPYLSQNEFFIKTLTRITPYTWGNERYFVGKDGDNS
jgi:hypothetical protein